MSDKIKIFTISDHPLSPSGVGTQTKYIIEGMLKTGKYQFLSFGGAMKHPDHQPQKTEQWGDDWVMWPVDGYGTQDHEIRVNVPMVYYHVWDNYPYPQFNRPAYLSNDHIACISELTYDIVQTVAPEVGSTYIPHAVNEEIFKPFTVEKKSEYKKAHGLEDKFVCVWNNRNARRKQSGTLIWWFKEFLDRVGRDKATLIMHTDTKDVHGQDLEAIINELGLTNQEVLFSRDKVEAADLAQLYAAADVTINISDAEGFGLATLESLSCGTPIMVTMTGGLQNQVTDGENWFGVGLEPASKAIIGSQQVPYIYEDRVNKDDFVNGLVSLYEMTQEERAAMGMAGREWTQKQYNFTDFMQKWDDLLTSINEEQGSWETRTGYLPYEVRMF